MKRSPRMRADSRSAAERRSGLKRLAIGVVFVALFWWLNWQSHRLGPVTVWGFFPLWLGYVLAADGLAASVRGTSLYARDRRRFLELFVYSVPLWWLFEYVNVFLANWAYVGAEHVHPLVRVAFASLSFSTVIPAVFVTAELLAPRMPERLGRAPQWQLSSRRLAATFLAGAVLFFAVTVAPRYFFPVAWFCVVLMVDPLVHLLGWPSLTKQAAGGEWRLIATLAAAALVCGFFWEMWNIRSSPKWVYDIPFLGFGKIFEMPILGFGGYLPFGLEVYCVYRLLSGLAGRDADAFPGWDFPSRANSAP